MIKLSQITCLAGVFMVHIQMFSQDPFIARTKLLDSLMAIEKFQQAEEIIQKDISYLMDIKDYYNATDYVFYLGKNTFKIKGKEKAEIEVLKFSNTFTKATNDAKSLRQLHLEIGSFYEFMGNNQKAFENNLKALEFTKQMTNARGEYFGLIYNNLSVFSTRLGNIPEAIDYGNLALQAYEKDPKTNADSQYIIYNSLGSLMWYSSKMDSALYYYKRAEKVLTSLEENPHNTYYRPATLQNNMAAIYSIEGNFDQALKAMRLTISNLNSYLKEDINEINKDNASEFLFQAIENYAGLYKDAGDFEKAKNILEHAYSLKTKYFQEDNPEIAKGQLLLGQIYLSLQNFKKADHFLNHSITGFENNPSKFTTWLADAYATKGLLAEEFDSIKKAKTYYSKSEEFYRAALDGYYDEMYLDFAARTSLFYAKNGFIDKAFQMSNEAYHYIIENQGSSTLIEYQQLLNLANISYVSGKYQQALEYCNQALEMLQDHPFSKNSEINSVQINIHKPELLLIKSKSQYALKTKKDLQFLKSLLVQMQEAISYLEKHKSFIQHESNTSILIQENASLFDFTKKLALEIYEKTEDETYLELSLNLHEATLYNKIRSRLNSKSSIGDSQIPKEIIQKEDSLKSRLYNTLNEGQIEDFFEAEAQWITFLENLEKQHPKYFELKYASISKRLNAIQSSIPQDRTIIRYAHVNKDLYAFVLDHENTYMVKLKVKDYENLIASLQDENAVFETNFKKLHELYLDLWKPIEALITSKHITIIPDSYLFNLNFEILIKEPSNQYSEMVENCLLNDYIISYNYSLYLIENQSKTINYKKDFVAFVPEFDKEMKKQYLMSIKDSLEIDQMYLKLLPQPFIKNLAEESKSIFRGDVFLNEHASKEIFVNQAADHKIIHIGTHAESNNISPELSRLIFAKKTNSGNDNYLYTYEIYNQNLASNLAILSACETGKPTYQSGEGMISLAHAFNYAGSESILTSLWKIDEQASTTILKSFYNYLSDGLPKDDALRHAKLDYLSSSKGRSLAPPYWGGLVLIGNTSPILIEEQTSLFTYIAASLILIMVLYFFIFSLMLRRK